MLGNVEGEAKKLIHLKLNLGSGRKTINCLVDNGASVNVIHKSFCEKFGLVECLYKLN